MTFGRESLTFYLLYKNASFTFTVRNARNKWKSIFLLFWLLHYFLLEKGYSLLGLFDQTVMLIMSDIHKLVFKCIVVIKETHSGEDEKCMLIMGKPVFAENVTSKKNSRTIKRKF